ncbi:hypothetical protein [Ferrovibrio sp.]|uniref:hypothetical protein n=1 Tax=Ferrovibrio sp. TaxID=1917215 RepID=UPI00311E7AEF
MLHPPKIKRHHLAAIALISLSALTACGDNADSYAKKGVAQIQKFVVDHEMSLVKKIQYNARVSIAEQGAEVPWSDLLDRQQNQSHHFNFSYAAQEEIVIAAFKAPAEIGCKIIEKMVPPPHEVRANPGVNAQVALSPQDLQAVCQSGTVQWWVLAFEDQRK